jgi:Lrp/AsnC family transcriptional regulator, regulator for asnA, asnC and gidA
MSTRSRPIGAAAKPMQVGAASNGAPVRRTKPRRPAHEPIDDINKAIIIELQKDGRRSYTAIADAVGLSEAAVRQRVQRLIDDGAMQIVAVTDPLQLGFRRMAMVGMRIDGDATKVAEALSKLPEVTYVVQSGGSFDLLAELVCEDDDHLIEVLNKTVRVFPGVRETETFMYLRLHKESYAWGVPGQ